VPLIPPFGCAFDSDLSLLSGIVDDMSAIADGWMPAVYIIADGYYR
jgi:hypothetical protein